MAKQAMVTLACGSDYFADWQRYCRPTWQSYCDAHGLDLICLDKPLDDSERARKRSAAWQKCLVLSQDFSARYDRVIWVDADILINPASPDITAGVSEECVGAVETWSRPDPSMREKLLSRSPGFWDSSPERKGVPYVPSSYYAEQGLSGAFDHVVQTGVLVFSPRRHRELLEHVYHDYEQTGGNYEMPALSLELMKAGCVHWLDYRFNVLWFFEKVLHYPFLLRPSAPSRRLVDRLWRRLGAALSAPVECRCGRWCATAAYMNTYFLHFAGGARSELPWVMTERGSFEKYLAAAPAQEGRHD